MKIRSVLWIGIVCVGAMAGGCASHAEPECFFQPEESRRDIQVVSEAQVARGALGDPTLYAAHFDEGQLNSLGEAKLERLIGASTPPSRIYVSVPADDSLAKARVESVEDYLRGNGVDGRIKVAAGSNPANGHSAAEAIKALERSEKSGAAEPAQAPFAPEAGTFK